MQFKTIQNNNLFYIYFYSLTIFVSKAFFTNSVDTSDIFLANFSKLSDITTVYSVFFEISSSRFIISPVDFDSSSVASVILENF